MDKAFEENGDPDDKILDSSIYSDSDRIPEDKSALEEYIVDNYEEKSFNIGMEEQDQTKMLQYLKNLSEKYLKAYNLIRQKMWTMLSMNFVELKETEEVKTVIKEEIRILEDHSESDTKKPMVRFKTDIVTFQSDQANNEEYKSKLDQIVENMNRKSQELDAK